MKIFIASFVLLCCCLSLSSAGSVIPITDPTGISQPGTYELQNNLDVIGPIGIEIRCSDVILDGKGFTITGDVDVQGTVAGIRARSPTGEQLNNITIKNCQVRQFKNGILFEKTDNSIISNNHITSIRTGPNVGIDILGSNNEIFDNFLDVQEGGSIMYGIGGIRTNIDLDYLDLDPKYPNEIINNTISGYSQGIICYGSGSLIQKNTLIDNRGYYGNSWQFYYGCAIYCQFWNKVIGNTISEGPVIGIEFSDVDDRSEIRDNIITGISGESAINYKIGMGTISNNIIKNNEGMGINLGDPYVTQPRQNLTISNNRIENNNDGGIKLDSLRSVTVIHNYISNNGVFGLCLKDSNYNIIYDNFFNNTYNVKYQGNFIGNTWSVPKTSGSNIVGGFFIGGNYWASPIGNGWSETHIDSDGDGMCDQPYLIYLFDVDTLPLYKVLLVELPGGSGPPTDIDDDHKYEDVNGNGRKDFADVVLFFNQMTWIATNEPISAFDYNGNSRIDFADVVWLFNNL